MDLKRYAPPLELLHASEFTLRDRIYLAPFVSSVDGSVTVLRGLPPELVGALCSRASRAKASLLRVLLDEYIYPVLHSADEAAAEELRDIIALYRKHGIAGKLTNRARRFFAKWLAQYGDESIAQMTGTHLVFRELSQVAIKHLEDRRIGLAPIEKSTRYVDYGAKVYGRYLYYRDPDIIACVGKNYERVMDALFDAYVSAVSRMKRWLSEAYPDVKPPVIGKRAFDICRGFLPMSTLSQVAFFGNGQAFMHMINNAAKHQLGELRWAAYAASRELNTEIPSLLLRLKDQKTHDYQEYLAQTRSRVCTFVDKFIPTISDSESVPLREAVTLEDYDGYGEEKIIAAMLYPASERPWEEVFRAVKNMHPSERERAVRAYFGGRKERWQKVGRALENVYLRYEITLNAGAYRDLHRHRMLTQERQLFTTHLGFDEPAEIKQAGLHDLFRMAMNRVGCLYQEIYDKFSAEHAQYATTLFHRVRFYQWTNLRELFWEIELRTGSQGHPDYRRIEQEKFRLLLDVYPTIAKFMLADMGEYDFARRDDEARAKRKEKRISERL